MKSKWKSKVGNYLNVIAASVSRFLLKFFILLILENIIGREELASLALAIPPADSK